MASLCENTWVSVQGVHLVVESGGLDMLKINPLYLQMGPSYLCKHISVWTDIPKLM